MHCVNPQTLFFLPDCMNLTVYINVHGCVCHCDTGTLQSSPPSLSSSTSQSSSPEDSDSDLAFSVNRSSSASESSLGRFPDMYACIFQRPQMKCWPSKYQMALTGSQQRCFTDAERYLHSWGTELLLVVMNHHQKGVGKKKSIGNYCFFFQINQ